jgi:hypothetical protein
MKQEMAKNTSDSVSFFRGRLFGIKYGQQSGGELWRLS